NPALQLLTTVLVFLGNTAYPIVLFFIIKFLNLVLKCTKHHKTIKYILQYPRRCSTHIYPWKATKWLCGVFVIILIINSIIEMSLDFKVFKDIPPGYRFVTIFTQSTWTRTAGFAGLDFGRISSGCLVMMIGFMYLSSYPTTVTLRETNPYMRCKENDNPDSGVMYQAKNLLAFDVICFYSFFFLICCCEQNELRADNDYTEFMILFEVISAYGTVGYSIPMKNGAYSVSANFKDICKVFMCCVMMFGKHRGFPERVDRGFTPYQLVLSRDDLESAVDYNERHEAVGLLDQTGKQAIRGDEVEMRTSKDSNLASVSMRSSSFDVGRICDATMRSSSNTNDPH
ncbi:sodium transporter, putative, partial [Entamoeba invadens IP1]